MEAQTLICCGSAIYRIVASPVVVDDLVFVPSRERPLLAVRAGGRGDVTQSHRVWSTNNGPDVPTPVSDGKYLYIVRDNGVMFCYDAHTGAELYGRQRVRPGTYSASPVLADGKIYVTSEDGITMVVKAGPQFEILAENDLNDYAQLAGHRQRTDLPADRFRALGHRPTAPVEASARAIV